MVNIHYVIIPNFVVKSPWCAGGDGHALDLTDRSWTDSWLQVLRLLTMSSSAESNWYRHCMIYLRPIYPLLGFTLPRQLPELYSHQRNGKVKEVSEPLLRLSYGLLTLYAVIPITIKARKLTVMVSKGQLPTRHGRWKAYVQAFSYLVRLFLTLYT